MKGRKKKKNVERFATSIETYHKSDWMPEQENKEKIEMNGTRESRHIFTVGYVYGLWAMSYEL